MKYEIGYWVDDNDNRWNEHLFNYREAERESKTLKNCSGCENCANCEDCTNCINCENCFNCKDCCNIEGLSNRYSMAGKHRRDYTKVS